MRNGRIKLFIHNMFSLCIPTMNRFDDFLKHNIPKYLENKLIDEIIIVDENGKDYEKCKSIYESNSKIKLFKNDTQLGPFLNKLKCCHLAKNDWIALIDSDNFANQTYFDNVMEYINTNTLNDETIISPGFAKPNFNYTTITPKVINKQTIKHVNNKQLLQVLMNTGNYVIHRKLMNNINIEKETENIKKSSSCDVIYFNTLLFEQFDLTFHILPHLEYEHVVHNKSIYLETHRQFKDFNVSIHERFKKFL